MYDNLTRTNLEFAHREAEKRIAELEKENKELKEQVKEWKVLQELYDGKAFKWQGKYGDVNKQLTEAKEIIRELLNSCFGYNSKTVNYEVKVKAEQFLQELDNENNGIT